MGATVAPMAGAEPFSFQGGPVGVLLCHGFTGSPQSMRPWGECLAATGFAVSCPRLPGHGTTWQEMNRTGWRDWYGEEERALRELRGRCDQVFVMGLSMGGTLALRLAEQHPDEVAGLVLVNPSVTTMDRRAFLAPLLKWFVPSLPGIANDIKKPGAREVAYDRVPLKAFDSLRQFWKLTRTDLGKVTAPLLVFHSPQDHAVEPVNTRIILDGVRSTGAENRPCPNSYHVATLDNDAPSIFEGSLAFVRAHTRSPSGS